jgi:flagellar motor switch protein FliG
MAEAAKQKEPNADEIYQGLTGTQKCAILMMLIGEDEAAGNYGKPVS